MSVDSFLLFPCVGLPLHDVGCLNSVVVESAIQGSGNRTYVALGAVLTSCLTDGICRLTIILFVLQAEQLLADGIGRFDGT